MKFIDEAEFLELYYPYVSNDLYLVNRVTKLYHELCDRLELFNSKDEISIQDLKAFIGDMQYKSESMFTQTKAMLLYIFEAHGYNNRSIRNLKKIKYEDIYLKEDVLRTYFASEKEIYDSVAMVSGLYHSRADYDFNGTQTVCGLLWYGFELVDIQKMLVEDIDFDNLIVFNRKTQENIVISESLMRFIDRFLRNREISSSYLFCGKDGGETQQSTVGKRLALLNGFEEETKKLFSAKNIYMSGLFERVYQGKVDYDTLRKDKKIKYDAWVKNYKE